MQNMQGMSGGNGLPGNPGGTMMNGGPGNGYFPPVNPGQTDLPSVSPRTDKSNICKCISGFNIECLGTFLSFTVIKINMWLNVLFFL